MRTIFIATVVLMMTTNLVAGEMRIEPTVKVNHADGSVRKFYFTPRPTLKAKELGAVSEPGFMLAGYSCSLSQQRTTLKGYEILYLLVTCADESLRLNEIAKICHMGSQEGPILAKNTALSLMRMKRGRDASSDITLGVSCFDM